MRIWQKLEAKYKVKKKNKHTGNANQSGKYHKQIAEYLGDSQRVNQDYTFNIEVNFSLSSSFNNNPEKSNEVDSF